MAPPLSPPAFPHAPLLFPTSNPPLSFAPCRRTPPPRGRRGSSEPPLHQNVTVPSRPHCLIIALPPRCVPTGPSLPDALPSLRWWSPRRPSLAVAADEPSANVLVCCPGHARRAVTAPRAWHRCRRPSARLGWAGRPLGYRPAVPRSRPLCHHTRAGFAHVPQAVGRFEA
jgi:hypothetical protein